jgi:hypothetical protein
MDQKEGAGHHAITRAAVREFFASGRAGTDGKIDGMTEDEYFHALDAAQEHADRWYGPTTHPAWEDPDAQREHGMADPYHSGQWNVDTDRQFVENELSQAHEGGARATEMGHVGAAAHALEDSYSQAHAFRGSAVNSGDPNAPIESFNVFDPIPNPNMGTWGKFGDEQGTHDERFDTTDVDAAGNPVHGSDQAAVHATAQMLESYHDHRGESMAQANAANHETVSQFYQPADGGVGVNTAATPEWRAERDRRLQEHADEDAARAAAGAGGAGGDGGGAGGSAYDPSEPNMSVEPPAEPNASYQPVEPSSSEPNASYQPPAEPTASYQPAEPNQSTPPAEPNASYQPAEPTASEPNASYQPEAASSSSPDGS